MNGSADASAGSGWLVKALAQEVLQLVEQVASSKWTRRLSFRMRLRPAAQKQTAQTHSKRDRMRARVRTGGGDSNGPRSRELPPRGGSKRIKRDA